MAGPLGAARACEGSGPAGRTELRNHRRANREHRHGDQQHQQCRHRDRGGFHRERRAVFECIGIKTSRLQHCRSSNFEPGNDEILSATDLRWAPHPLNPNEEWTTWM